jgi:hypothetical protein
MFTVTMAPGLNAAFPDACHTPPPVPFPNMQISTVSFPAVFNCLINGAPVLNQISRGKLSFSDEPGVSGGGVVSHTIKGDAQYMIGSFKYFVGGAPVVRSFLPTMQNCMAVLPNAPGLAVIPSQFVEMVLV